MPMNKAQPFALESPDRHLKMVPLGGKRIFGLGLSHGYISEDGGRTWGEPFDLRHAGEVMLDGKDSPALGDLGSLDPAPGCILTVCGLSSGKIAGVLRQPLPELSKQYAHNNWFRVRFMTSQDEGRTWTGVSPMGHPVETLECINSMIQLRSGRILLPMNWFASDYEHREYKGDGTGHSFRGGYGLFHGRNMLVEGHSHTPEFGTVVVLYSDDEGRTWKSGPNNLWIWPLPSEGNIGGHSALYEPVVVEVDDNRVLMMCRTLMGCLYRCISEDGGIHWSIPEPTELVSSDSPCMMARIPSTGDIVIAWNQVSPGEIMCGLKRSRICCAVSSDGGESWTNVKTLDCLGLQPAGKMQRGPIRHYHAMDEGVIVPAEGFGCYDYPNIAVVDDRVLFFYNAQRLLPISEWKKDSPIYGERKFWGQIRAYPLSWLHE